MGVPDDPHRTAPFGALVLYLEQGRYADRGEDLDVGQIHLDGEGLFTDLGDDRARRGGSASGGSAASPATLTRSALPLPRKVVIFTMT